MKSEPEEELNALRAENADLHAQEAAFRAKKEALLAEQTAWRVILMTRKEEHSLMQRVVSELQAQVTKLEEEVAQAESNSDKPSPIEDSTPRTHGRRRKSGKHQR